MTGLYDAQGKPVSSQMRSERFEVEYGGPALVQATATGSLIDPQHGTTPGLVRAAVPALDRPADPRDRGHAERSRPRLAGPGGPGRPVVGLPGVPLGLARPQLDAAPDWSSGRPSSPRSNAPRRPMRSTSRRGPSGRPCSSAACRITASTAAACSTRCWSPARNRRVRSRSGSCSTSSIRSMPLRTCSRRPWSCRSTTVRRRWAPPAGWRRSTTRESPCRTSSLSRDQRRPRLGPGLPPARNGRPLGAVSPAAVSRPVLGTPDRLPGRDHRRPVDRRRRRVDRPDAARAGADRGDAGLVCSPTRRTPTSEYKPVVHPRKKSARARRIGQPQKDTRTGMSDLNSTVLMARAFVVWNSTASQFFGLIAFFIVIVIPFRQVRRWRRGA